ncbi:MAG: MFS transporter [Fidelibacterota bacterium]|nr:MAG: MFS transporter [Candidatus Neomarinimicrobiota bacterium]
MTSHIATSAEMEIHRHKIHRGYHGFPTRLFMRLSSVEGAFSQVHVILTGGVFLTALALSMGAQPWQLGLLAAVPHITQIFQLIGAYLVEATHHRKLTAILGFGISRLLWIGIPFLFLMQNSQTAVAWFLAIIIASSSLGLLAGNAWTTWMADLIPPRLRGRYFGFRHGIIAAVTIGSSVLGGIWLDWGGDILGEATALTYIVGVASLAGFVGVVLLGRQPDIHRPEERKAPRFRDLITGPVKNRQFRRSLEFFMAWNVAIGFTAAFFNVHLIRELGVSFITIGLFQSVNPFLGIFLFKWWGRIIDRFQIRSVLLVSGLVVTTLPIIWLFPTSEHPGWIWVIAILSGLSWTGFNLSAYTYPMRYSPRIGRSYYLAYFYIISGLGFVVSALAGGIFAQTLADWRVSWPILEGRTFMVHHIMFVITAGMRVLSLTLLFRLRDVKAEGTIALVSHIGSHIWRAASWGRPFPRWIRRRIPSSPPTDTPPLNIPD